MQGLVITVAIVPQTAIEATVTLLATVVMVMMAAIVSTKVAIVVTMAAMGLRQRWQTASTRAHATALADD